MSGQCHSLFCNGATVPNLCRRSYSALRDVTHLQGIELQFHSLNLLLSVILSGGAEVKSKITALSFCGF